MNERKEIQSGQLKPLACDVMTKTWIDFPGHKLHNRSLSAENRKHSNLVQGGPDFARNSKIYVQWKIQ